MASLCYLLLIQRHKDAQYLVGLKPNFVHVYLEESFMKSQRSAKRHVYKTVLLNS